MPKKSVEFETRMDFGMNSDIVFVVVLNCVEIETVVYIVFEGYIKYITK